MVSACDVECRHGTTSSECHLLTSRKQVFRKAICDRTKSLSKFLYRTLGVISEVPRVHVNCCNRQLTTQKVVQSLAAAGVQNPPHNNAGLDYNNINLYDHTPLNTIYVIVLPPAPVPWPVLPLPAPVPVEEPYPAPVVVPVDDP